MRNITFIAFPYLYIKLGCSVALYGWHYMVDRRNEVFGTYINTNTKFFRFIGEFIKKISTKLGKLVSVIPYAVTCRAT